MRNAWKFAEKDFYRWQGFPSGIAFGNSFIQIGNFRLGRRAGIRFYRI